VTVPELAIIAATRGVIGFGAGLLLADSSRVNDASCWAGRCFCQAWQAQFRLRCTFSEKNKRLLLNPKRIGLLPNAEQVYES
jgi:hypothetical protein